MFDFRNYLFENRNLCALLREIYQKLLYIRVRVRDCEIFRNQKQFSIVKSLYQIASKKTTHILRFSDTIFRFCKKFLEVLRAVRSTSTTFCSAVCLYFTMPLFAHFCIFCALVTLKKRIYRRLLCGSFFDFLPFFCKNQNIVSVFRNICVVF